MLKLTYADLCAAAEAYHNASAGYPMPQIGTIVYNTAGVHFLEEVPRFHYAKLIVQFGKSPTKTLRSKKAPRALVKRSGQDNFGDECIQKLRPQRNRPR